MCDLMKKYNKLIFIRMFEQKILELFSQNLLSGTTHTCIGQEAVAVAAMEYIGENDIVFSNHRCHGHYLAYGGSAEALLAEIMSRENGICEGRGGSQHIHFNNFYSNGVQGGIVPNAAGMAWAEKLKDTGNIAVVFLGDGTLGQGVVYETLNMASLYEIPILFVVENNQYAMTTKVSDAVAGSITGRFQAFGIECDEVSGNEMETMEEHFQNAYHYVRSNKRPFCQIIHTYRLGAHSKGDDTRDIEEIDAHRKEDVILKLEQKLGKASCDEIKSRISDYLEDIVKRTEKKAVKKIEIATEARCRNRNISEYNCDNIRCVSAINSALDEYMQNNQDVLLLGEDIRDSYGGAFKVTKGLSEKYGNRVINTPISEAGFTGLAVGLAMGGKRPIVEMMFGDFVTLAFDQILNHAAKYSWVYGQNVEVPLIIRLPMGGGRGYGPTHSQSLEKFLIGIPLITIMAISPVHNVKGLYQCAFENTKNPILVIENKSLYSEKLMCRKDEKIQDFYTETSWKHIFPSIKLSLDKLEKPDVVIITYGSMVKEIMEISLEFMLRDEIQIDIIAVAQLSPVPMEDLLELISDADIIGTVEEGTGRAGWGAEVIASLHEMLPDKKYFRVAAEDIPIPNGILLEKQVACSKENITVKIRGALK